MTARDRRRQGSARVVRLHEDDGAFDQLLASNFAR